MVITHGIQIMILLHIYLRENQTSLLTNHNLKSIVRHQTGFTLSY